MIRRSIHVTALGLLLLPAPCFHAAETGKPLASVTLPQAVLDSMNAVFAESNLNWDKLQDLNTMERMLGTIRPTQREYLGCLQGDVAPVSVTVVGYVPARNMRRLQLAVTGSCDSIPGVVGSWHTHPFHADSANQPLKSRVLSPQDLATFTASADRVAIVVWDHDSLDAAVKLPDGTVVHPAQVEIK
jgi:hypothetical protein